MEAEIPSPEETRAPSGLPFPSAFAFIGSGSLLVLELVAGRILAPVVGVSLYTWTSIIGVVLAGISLGNWIGGRIADRKPSRATLSAVYTFAALSSALILVMARDPAKLAAPQSWPAIVQVTWVAGIMFFVPATLLGMPTPIIVKLILSSLGSTGRVVGRIQAAATLGAIVGTFATGFFLISAFGTRTIVGTVSIVLFVLGLASSPVWDRRRVLQSLVILAYLGGALGLSKAQCTVESNYFCIRVEDTNVAGTKVLKLDLLEHGYVDLADPTRLLYPYEVLYARLLDIAVPRATRMDSLLLGGGTYTFPRWIERFHPGRIIVAEIDPDVTAVAERHLALRPGRLDIRHDDARRVVLSLADREQFDVILGDTFNDLSVPYHLTTLEFDRMIAGHLRDSGLYLINVVDGVEHGFLRSYMTTLQKVFPYVGLLTTPDAWPPVKIRKTFVVVAAFKKPPAVEGLVSQDEIAEFLKGTPSVLLTDDHVPTDQLLAPLFRQRLQG